MALLEARAPDDPYRLFAAWYREAERADEPQPDAVALATAGADCQPAVRMVLFKGVDEGAFLFYSNYGSGKGRALSENGRAAMAFHWSSTGHQVRVSGTVRRLSRTASAAYFHSRPRGAQLSALASRQSRIVASRDVMEKAVARLASEHPGQVSLPRDWGGYALRPRWIEFWEHREDRLHDRLRYVRRRDGRWRLERLSP